MQRRDFTVLLPFDARKNAVDWAGQDGKESHGLIACARFSISTVHILAASRENLLSCGADSDSFSHRPTAHMNVRVRLHCPTACSLAVSVSRPMCPEADLQTDPKPVPERDDM